GAILYECLIGRPPFKAGSALETLQQVLHEESAPPHRLRATVPRDLETVCLKCLEKDPARRYATAGALADDLERYLAGEAVRARPVGWAGRLWRWGRRHRAALTGAALATAATLLVVALWPEDPTGSRAAHQGSGQQTSPQTAAPDDSELLVRVTTTAGEHTGPGSLYFEKGVALTNSELLG